MDIFLYLLLQILNGDKWEPVFANSSKYKNWVANLDLKTLGWKNEKGNLNNVCPNKMIFGGEYYNDNGHLPNKSGRVWYEADINYRFGYRNTQRVVYSNDGLIFVTYDHYQTFFEII